MSAPSRDAHPGLARIALLALLWLALLAWARPLLLPDEGRYVGVAWGMLRSGDWLTPTLDGLPYFHKPPLFYWITATAMKLFGVWEWPARLASVLGAWAGALAVFLLLRRWWGERDARLALWVLLLQPAFYLGAQFANLDMLVAGAITVTIALLAQAALALERDQPYRSALLGAYVAAALAVLAKGLIGMVLPGLVVTAWLLSGGRWRTWLRLLSLPGLVLFALVAAPWFIAMQQRFPEFLHYFFVVQHFQRFAESGFNNVQPFWFYPAVLVLATLTWLPWLKPLFARGETVDPLRADLRRLMWLWVVLVTGFFSLPASKLVGYILPAIPPLAVLLADGVAVYRRRHGRLGRGWWASAGVSVAFCVLVISVLAARTPHSSKGLGLELRAQRQAGEPVFLLGEYYFDLPIYARLEQPVAYVLDWDDPAIRARDTWRKELADAGGFDPALAPTLLLRPVQLAPSLCRSPVAWLVGPRAAPQTFPVLGQARQVAANGEAALWRITPAAPAVRAALGCPGTPTAGSPSR
ncbi:ArnT family glycosyltransferase [Thermomonas paludicola]|uniref:ArnT family glycosyltransferase n=1 Tax=Thermomonas paludicola TaxID=2884874 RepID=UPI002114A6A9|nr:glycosyltransferase family 39 protein [Thermomonas paludicola]